jgi:beta-glucosidase
MAGPNKTGSTHDGNDEMVPYRDPKLSIDERVEDLLSRMTVAEKAGQLFHDKITIGPGGTLSLPNEAFRMAGTEKSVGERLMTHFNLLGPVQDVRVTAEWYNRLQKRAQETRLGIPITLSTDPRNHFTDNVGTGFSAAVLSQWPETLGLAAIGSEDLVQRFADVARQEYIAIGLRCALHPQIDLATEPRWSRIGATFGEDADLTSKLVAAYIRGFQGSALGPQSVTTMTKHFPGGGPQKDGEDPHFTYGREQIYPGNNQIYHLKPFKAALAAGTSQIMPYYGMPIGTEDWDEVGFAYNKPVITGLLREQLGFEGIVCTDWGLITNTYIMGQPMPARAWGLEHLSELELTKAILDAGCDQFGGESRPELVVQLVQDNHLPESRIDISVRRILREKFILGLFDNPFVDVDAAVSIVGNPRFKAEGEDAQRRSFTLLTNKDDILPISLPSDPSSRYRKVYAENVNPALLTTQGFTIVSFPQEADIALLRLKAPYEPRPGGFEALFHAGSLEFPSAEIARLQVIFKACPTVVDIHLDRPAVLREIATGAAALMVSYGSSAEAFVDVAQRKSGQCPEGRLPFDLPRSMQAVSESRPDVQYDTKEPCFKFGHGLRYS